MKSILDRCFSKKPDNKPADLEIRRLANRAEILAHLDPRKPYAVSAYAYVESSFPQIAKWHLATEGSHSALCLTGRGLSPTYLFTMGDTQVLEFLLDSVNLPGRTIITCEPEHLGTVRKFYEFEWHLLTKRMLVNRDTFTPATEWATRIEPSQVGEVNHLFRLTNSGRLTSAQIKKGVFYGIWADDMLVAVAGTILVLPTYSIGYVGNVVTHSAYRNQRMATACVNSVTSKLLEQCKEAVLNVEMHNLPAVRTYTGLGYQDYCQIIEGVAHRKSFIGDIINNVCRKIGLIEYEERMEPDG